jgi:predicted Zn-dependent protease
VKEHPQIDEFRIALIQAQAKAGQAKAAMASVQAGLKLRPTSIPLLMARLGLLEAAGQFGAASKLLKELVEKHPQDERLFHRLSLAEGKLKHTAQAHGYRAEYHYLRGEYQAAVYQLEAALRYPLSDYRKAKLTARLKQCRQAFLEAKREAKR